MKLVFTFEHRFSVTPDGKIWTPRAYGEFFWRRYLEVFDQVQVVARVGEVMEVPSNYERADSEYVTFNLLPCYIGPAQFLQNIRKIRKRLRVSYTDEASFIVRPGVLGTLMLRELQKRDHPYGVETINDPRDAFAPGVIIHPFRPFFRWWFSRNLVNQCAEADATLYVTENALQRRYPCPGFSIGVSDVSLTEDAIVDVPRRYPRSEGMLTIVYVGTLAQLYKAPHILIDAAASCVREGLNLQLRMVGDGKYRGELERKAKDLGLADRIIFLGQLKAGAQVREQLDNADLFVLPSYTEGMPRAMLEAMARGLPCIGSTVGGVPELLPAEDMVSPGNAQELARKIQDVLGDPNRLSRMSERNLEKVHAYSDQILHDRRLAFIQYMHDVTESWLSGEH